MTEETTLFFEELKKTRKSKKISIKELSDYTKINSTYLEDLESGNFNTLPNVYTRLFLRSYCEYIGVDSREMLNQYEIYTLGDKKKDISEAEALSDNNMQDEQESSTNVNLNLSSKNYKEITVTAVVVIVLIVLFIIINSINTA
tara:strand:+ start:93 stop:524 length:432 start_codon:yes stop_codon:yes gene_type:complete